MSNINQSPNNLIQSKSPYLLQHAYNPVEWQIWDSSIWEQANVENKLVLISIGYSTCHWCHVMEKESFEDWETAEIMNQHLICVKVDREERPDIDMVYMEFCQQMTGRGGWPLNVICLPNGKPIYSGTYFPKKDWQQILLQLSFHFKNEPETFTEYADKFMDQFNVQSNEEGLEPFSFYRETMVETFTHFVDGVDWEHGGMNRVPKFMMPLQLEYALDYEILSKDERAKEYLHLTLLKMANGGICDVLRGGFFRYSTDRYWFAPHFEKMLYDNAQLASVYCKAYGWSTADIYKSIAMDIFSFLEREMHSELGGYFSALDADFEGQEGGYYTFTFAEIQSVATPSELEFLTAKYGIQDQGNWEHSLNILSTQKAPLELLNELQINAEQYHLLNESTLQKLWNLQQNRNRPGLDYKVILSWNALLLGSFKDACLYLDYNYYIAKAHKLANFLWFGFVDVERKTVKRLNTKGESYGSAFLEDFALLAKGYLDMYQTDFDEGWIIKAKWLTDLAIETFYHPEEKRFYYAPIQQTELIINKIDLIDDVIGSSGSYLARVLLQLAVFYPTARYQVLADQLLQSVATEVAENPAWYSHWATIIHERTLGPVHVSVPSTVSMADILSFRKEIPSWVVVGKISDDSMIEWLNSSQASSMIQVCAGQQCFEPVTDFNQAVEIIEEWVSLY